VIVTNGTGAHTDQQREHQTVSRASCKNTTQACERPKLARQGKLAHSGAVAEDDQA
jgi:hypothetical protein